MKLSQQFFGYFIRGQRHRKLTTYLLNLKQSKGESLRDYMSQFNKEALQVNEADGKMIIVALTAEMLPFKLLFSLSKNPPSRMTDLMVKAQQQPTPREDRRGQGREGDVNRRVQPRVNLPPSRFQKYTPLNAPMEQVFVHIKNDLSIKWPKRIRAPREKKPRQVLPFLPGPWP